MTTYKPSKDLKQFIKVIEDHVFSTDYTFIILGKSGPTGKTYLTNLIIKNGYKAIDISESLYGIVNYIPNDNKNHYHIDYLRQVFVVVLNNPLKKL